MNERPALYLESSAALKLVFAEPETPVLHRYLESHRPWLATSQLTEVEMGRAVFRSSLITQEIVTNILADVNVFELTPEILKQARLLPGKNLRSLDAIHLAAALSIGASGILSYDNRLNEAATLVGLPVVSPQ